MLRDLSKESSICQQYVAEIRDASVQKDPMRFRRNLERIGEIGAYETSKLLQYQSVGITTPLADAEALQLVQQPVIVSILRAGLTMHQGVLNYFDRAENAFISAFRKPHSKGEEIEVEVEYLACPTLEGKELILCDPMLATGTSLLLAYEALLSKGTPARVHIICAIASQQGVNRVLDEMPHGTHLLCAAIDPLLNDMSYIVPGLGDAGDLAYGVKA